MLIEPIQPINLGTKEHYHIIHLAQSLSIEEKEKFTQFFKKKMINFKWIYTDLPGLDTELIMHHLSIAPSVKLVKQKLRKMHPHVA